MCLRCAKLLSPLGSTFARRIQLLASFHRLSSHWRTALKRYFEITSVNTRTKRTWVVPKRHNDVSLSVHFQQRLTMEYQLRVNADRNTPSCGPTLTLHQFCICLLWHWRHSKPTHIIRRIPTAPTDRTALRSLNGPQSVRISAAFSQTATTDPGSTD
jgi:hypothetical protein